MIKQQIPSLNLPTEDNCCPTNSKNYDMTPRTEQEIWEYLHSEDTMPTSAEYVNTLEEYDEQKLQLIFELDMQHNKYDFLEAVKQNKIELVKKILKINPKLINAKTSDGYNVLHKALMGETSLEMIEFLLQKNPILATYFDKEKLTPVGFMEKNGFNKNLSASQIEQIKELLKNAEAQYILTPRTEEGIFNFLNDDLGGLLGSKFEHGET